MEQQSSSFNQENFAVKADPLCPHINEMSLFRTEGLKHEAPCNFFKLKMEQ